MARGFEISLEMERAYLGAIGRCRDAGVSDPPGGAHQRPAPLRGQEGLGDPEVGRGRPARRSLGRRAGIRAGHRPGVGQSSMRERAKLIGGELEIESQPGQGTSVRLRVPLPQGVQQ